MKEFIDALCDPEVQFVLRLTVILLIFWIIEYIREWHEELEEERKKNSIYYKRNHKDL